MWGKSDARFGISTKNFTIETRLLLTFWPKTTIVGNVTGPLVNFGIPISLILFYLRISFDSTMHFKSSLQYLLTKTKQKLIGLRKKIKIDPIYFTPHHLNNKRDFIIDKQIPRDLEIFNKCLSYPPSLLCNLNYQLYSYFKDLIQSWLSGRISAKSEIFITLIVSLL